MKFKTNSFPLSRSNNDSPAASNSKFPQCVILIPRSQNQKGGLLSKRAKNFFDAFPYTIKEIKAASHVNVSFRTSIKAV